MLRTLRRQGTKVLPSNSRARRRQTSGPLQGLPASKPVRGPRTLRSLVSASVGIPAALHPSATSAWKLVSEEEGMPGRKVPVRVPSVLLHRPSPAGSLSAVREVCRLRRFAWGRPGTSSRVSGRACHTTSGTVPPRYGFAVSSPACYSSRPCVFSVLCAVLAALRQDGPVLSHGRCAPLLPFQRLTAAALSCSTRSAASLASSASALSAGMTSRTVT